jgi:hypothetical protein
MKWSGTVLTVLLLVLWVGSAWWLAGFELSPMGGLQVSAGKVGIGWRESLSITPVSSIWWTPGRHSRPFEWWLAGERRTFQRGVAVTAVEIPIWMLVVLFGIPTLWLWRRDRRGQPGLCIKCGYDLRGADHRVCPECGNG